MSDDRQPGIISVANGMATMLVHMLVHYDIQMERAGIVSTLSQIPKIRTMPPVSPALE